jgi:hypothetical protein
MLQDSLSFRRLRAAADLRLKRPMRTLGDGLSGDLVSARRPAGRSRTVWPAIPLAAKEQAHLVKVLC